MAGRKRIRLDRQNYAVPGTVWHVTFTTLDRRPCLRKPLAIEMVIDALEFQCRKSKADLLLYCIMPDHAHAVIMVGEEDLISIIRDVKTWTTKQWTHQTGKARLWQKSFYDHGVRRTETIEELIAYVTENPSEAGLIAQWWDYPWVGGSLLEPN